MTTRVLIVDDYPRAAEVLAQVLKRSGTEVATACDGLQAVDTAEQFRPDVMVVDIRLPKLNGYEVARKIRRQPWSERTILIAITGGLGHDERMCAQDSGFDAILLKPFGYAMLLAVIAECSPPALHKPEPRGPIPGRQSAISAFRSSPAKTSGRTRHRKRDASLGLIDP